MARIVPNAEAFTGSPVRAQCARPPGNPVDREVQHDSAQRTHPTDSSAGATSTVTNGRQQRQRELIIERPATATISTGVVEDPLRQPDQKRPPTTCCLNRQHAWPCDTVSAMAKARIAGRFMHARWHSR